MKNLVDYIPEEEIELINDWRRNDKEIAAAVLRHGDILAPTRDILQEWASQKEELFHLLGDQLIISKEICITKDEEILRRECQETLRMDPFRTAFWKRENEFKDLIEFYHNCDYDYDIIDLLSHLLGSYSLVNNKADMAGKLVFTATGHSIQFSDNTKPMRIIKKIVDELGIEGFEEFRVKVSQVLNNKKLQGTLCLSIHPLDFMTMSNNDCQWSSCMSWGSYVGAYRGGVVEMMNSPIVVEAYLKSNTDMVMPQGDTWSNKKWRELFIVHPSCILGIKGYPYEAPALEECCVDWIKQLAWTNLQRDYKPPERLQKIELPSIFDTEVMYNDVYSDHLCARCLDVEAPEEINYSGRRTCMVCGKLYEDDGPWECADDTCAHITCDDCTPYIECDECGNTVLYSDCEEVNGKLLCTFCYDELKHCANCGEPLLQSDYGYTYREYMVTRNGIYNWNYVLHFCDDCIESGKIINPDDIQGMRVDVHWYDSEILYLDYDLLTPEGKKIVDHNFNVDEARNSEYVTSIQVEPLTIPFQDFNTNY